MRHVQVREIVNGWLVLMTDNRTIYKEEFYEDIMEALSVAGTFLKKKEKDGE